MLDFFHWLQQRLSRPLPGEQAQRRMIHVSRPKLSEAPPEARKSAVLVLLHPQHTHPSVVLIQRTIDGSVHSGQIAFPGGRQEDYDIDFADTALREANEEIALERKGIGILGQLTGLYIPVSNFVVYPVLAFAASQPLLFPSESEVSRILHVPLPKLFARKKTVSIPVSSAGNIIMRVPAYLPEEQTIVWGATAMILSELEALWEEYLIALSQN
jgi:8-oxo-dGTP pyrophosphatase MutT (NUDIX family)